MAELAWSCVLLSLAMLLVFPGFALFGHSTAGAAGVLAASVAGGVCWISMLLALVLVGWFSSIGMPVQATLLGMFFRMGLPLMVGILLTQQGGELVSAGVFGMIVVYYLIGLVVETLLSVYLVGSAQQSAKAS